MPEPGAILTVLLREEVLVISGANIRTTESLIGAAVDN